MDSLGSRIGLLLAWRARLFALRNSDRLSVSLVGSHKRAVAVGPLAAAWRSSARRRVLFDLSLSLDPAVPQQSAGVGNRTHPHTCRAMAIWNARGHLRCVDCVMAFLRKANDSGRR